ncbi:probable metabolite transport protein CsbC [Amyelois transitella]|uniref:probable metabolite transport protein CsbC n=1 Tax=Amyelois transitella TaxID=680683 RepID=UPI00298FB56F|nr:probable metabolite transport protein CsbC [Amyelois transitella]
MGIRMQVCGSIIVCFLSMSMGAMFTWPSSSLMLLRSEDTVLNRPMTDGEAALLGSISSISNLISCPIVGFFLDKVGRKYCAIVSSSMSVICWTLIAFSSKVELVLAAIFISGLSGAGYLVVPVFVSEFCQDSIRGAMTSGSVIFSGTGMLLSYLLGGLLDYYTMSYVYLVVAIVSVLLLFWLRESPVYLMKVGREKDAINSVAFYRSEPPTSKEVLHEIDNIRRALSFGPDSDCPEEETLKTMKKPDISPWEFFKRSKATRRAFYICLILTTASVFQGIVVIQVYAGPLFEQVIPEMSTTLASVLFGVISVTTGIVAAYLTDLIGRRPLIIYSSAAAGACCVLCGTQIQLEWGPTWVTPFFIYLFTMFYTFGAGTVTFVLLAEIFLPEVKSYINMISIEWLSLCNFFVLVIFDPLTNLIGLGSVFHFFAAICVLTGIFSFFYIPETKGLPVDEIQSLFAPPKKTEQFNMS